MKYWPKRVEALMLDLGMDPKRADPRMVLAWVNILEPDRALSDLTTEELRDVVERAANQCRRTPMFSALLAESYGL